MGGRKASLETMRISLYFSLMCTVWVCVCVGAHVGDKVDTGVFQRHSYAGRAPLSTPELSSEAEIKVSCQAH